MKIRFNSTSSALLKNSSIYKNIGTGGFADYKHCRIFGGHGGDGAIAFTHGASKNLGPPCGGNGGRGGDLYITASKYVTSLHEIHDSYRIEDGKPGGKFFFKIRWQNYEWTRWTQL